MASLLAYSLRRCKGPLQPPTPPIILRSARSRCVAAALPGRGVGQSVMTMPTDSPLSSSGKLGPPTITPTTGTTGSFASVDDSGPATQRQTSASLIAYIRDHGLAATVLPEVDPAALPPGSAIVVRCGRWWRQMCGQAKAWSHRNSLGDPRGLRPCSAVP